jgi:putative NADH-flavin reductase
MKILLLGANGRTGRELTKRALSLDMEVTAVVRSADRMPDALARDVRLCVTDPCSSAALTPLVAGHDAVVSVLGPRLPSANAASVYSRSADAIVAAMRNSDIRRLLVTSSAMLFPQRRLLDRLLKRLVAQVVEAAAAMEAQIRVSNLDWTIARTSFLTNSDATTARVLSERDAGNRAPTGAVSRTAVARFLLDEAQQGHHRQEVVALFG